MKENVIGEGIKGISVTIIFDDLFFKRKISKANIEKIWRLEETWWWK